MAAVRVPAVASAQMFTSRFLSLPLRVQTSRRAMTEADEYPYTKSSGV